MKNLHIIVLFIVSAFLFSCDTSPKPNGIYINDGSDDYYVLKRSLHINGSKVKTYYAKAWCTLGGRIMARKNWNMSQSSPYFKQEDKSIECSAVLEKLVDESTEVELVYALHIKDCKPAEKKFSYDPVYDEIMLHYSEPTGKDNIYMLYRKADQ